MFVCCGSRPVTSLELFPDCRCPKHLTPNALCLVQAVETWLTSDFPDRTTFWEKGANTGLFRQTYGGSVGQMCAWSLSEEDFFLGLLAWVVGEKGNSFSMLPQPNIMDFLWLLFTFRIRDFTNWVNKIPCALVKFPNSLCFLWQGIYFCHFPCAVGNLILKFWYSKKEIKKMFLTLCHTWDSNLWYPKFMESEATSGGDLLDDLSTWWSTDPLRWYP